MAENRRAPDAGAGGDGGGGGGFMPQSLPSPAPSTASSTSRTTAAGLPHPRSSALRPGSAKEDRVRNFFSERMMHISRRFHTRSDGAPPPGAAEAVDRKDDDRDDDDDDAAAERYKTMGELCRDLDGLINIVWLCGTPSLQIPYLLSIASEFNTWVAGNPAAPAPTFRILRKLDHCFASLLAGEDIETREPLPGFHRGGGGLLLRGGMSRTDMVRCKSVVQQARVVIVDVMSRQQSGREERAEGDGDGTGAETETADDTESGWDGGPSSRAGREDWEDEEEAQLHMDVARVYENTLVKLGETLGETFGAESLEVSESC